MRMQSEEGRSRSDQHSSVQSGVLRRNYDRLVPLATATWSLVFSSLSLL